MAKHEGPRRGFGNVFQDTYTDRHGVVKRVSTWSVRYFAKGKQWTKSAHTTDKRQAEALLRQLTATQAPPPTTDKVTFEQLAEGLLNDYRANKRRSLDRVTYSLQHLTAAFAGCKARDLNAATVTAYITARQAEGAANGSVNRELAALRRMFVLGRKAKRVRVDDIPEIELLQEAAPRKGFFELEQFHAVRRHLPAHLRNLVTVAYWTGWRLKSELLTRQWQHVDLSAGWLRLEPGETKNGEGRQFPVIPELREALRQQREYTAACQKERGEIIPWVFHKDGHPIGEFRRAWRTACKQAGCPGRIVHDFRRTAVRNLERSGVSRSAGMAMVGHRTASIYKRYSIVDEQDLKQAGDKLAQLTKGVLRESASRERGERGLTS